MFVSWVWWTLCCVWYWDGLGGALVFEYIVVTEGGSMHVSWGSQGGAAASAAESAA